MASIRILIVEDHHIFRMGLRRACESDPDVQVIGEACDGQEAVEFSRKLKPDVILMDINMPGMDGIEATRQIAQENGRVGIIMLTVIRDDTHIFEAIKAGARGYLLKDVNEEELLHSIHVVNRGEGLIDPEIAARVLEEFRRISQNGNGSQEFEQLTDVEMEILCRVAQGKENIEISTEMSISEKTVVNRLSTIYQKLHVNNRTQAALFALRKGWTSIRINL